MTKGPWTFSGSIYDHMGAEVSGRVGIAQLWQSDRVALDAQHISKCDPQTISVIVSELIERRNKDAEHEL